ncbi:MAG: alanyl-tRNA synthetase [Candidatus Gottesmanbacteria bacterium GW2011_GWA1_34_13]|uniref:alanine--tRNA ligase n=1 Tax=Candidatus Gottesmanbacteria bacterium GW2011_GWA1_34_13 TaxID=1618434 RepID=A0A0G0B382_9BACT|nr:MAG: alanyl-tRNA synthetase [Candidatus Gottesmanbacteria bacterium GW2011_GWA1_34_13]
MTSSEIRQKYIQFFVSHGHKEIPSASLVPENDPTTLFTSSGMQPLVPYLLGQPHPLGKRLVNSQKSFRSQDIDEVGDNRHTTFFEMLGNWSLGDYFKKEQLSWIWEFLIKELKLDPKKLYVSVFEGNKSVPKDMESINIWQELFSQVGIDVKPTDVKTMAGKLNERIFTYPAEKNWWSRSGVPEKMPAGEPGGPDSEIFYDFGENLKLHENSKFKDKPCHPNCDCGRFLEIGNSVFMEYQKQADGFVKPLKQKNVDFGGGLERLTAAVNNNPDVFKSDFFIEAIKSLEAIRKSGEIYSKDPKPYRIIVDHLRAAIFMVADGVAPSNKERGYMLRRLIRRAMVYSRKLGMVGDEWLSNTFAQLVVPYIKVYPYIEQKVPEINEIITQEVDKFRKTIEEGIKALKKIFGRAIGGIDPEKVPQGNISNNIIRIDGNEVFRIYETYGLAPEISQEIMTGWGLAFDNKTMKECQEAMMKHQQQSRTAAKGMFKGGLQDQSEAVIKLHTATHLLHQALRLTLGNNVSQKGSNITAERLRFDFSHTQKLTPEEITKVENLVNEQIKKDLPVSFAVMTYEEAIKKGALAFFGERYPEKVKVYTVGNPSMDSASSSQASSGNKDLRVFSKEICGGPHVEHTGILGKFKIIKEENLGAGLRRIYGKLEK